MARRKIVAAGAFAVSLFLFACTESRPLGTVTTDAGGGTGGRADGSRRRRGGTGGMVDAGSPAWRAGWDAPIQVLVWNNALTWGHAARALAIPYLKARELTDNITFDTTYAHTGPELQDGPTDAASTPPCSPIRGSTNMTS